MIKRKIYDRFQPPIKIMGVLYLVIVSDQKKPEI